MTSTIDLKNDIIENEQERDFDFFTVPIAIIWLNEIRLSSTKCSTS